MFADFYIIFAFMQVRADYQRCSQRSHAYCNCAVAVKSGDDVITIAGCQERTSHGVGNILQALFGHHHGHGHNRTPMTIQMYINGQLTAGTFVRRYGCGQKYEVHPFFVFLTKGEWIHLQGR